MIAKLCMSAHNLQIEMGRRTLTPKEVQVYAPMQHMRSDMCPSASRSRDEFQIIGRETNPYIRRVKESIFISTKKPKSTPKGQIIIEADFLKT